MTFQLEVPMSNLNPEEIATEICEKNSRKCVVAALHITALNSIYTRELRKEHFAKVDFLYADGWSVQILNRLSGVKSADRIATTDFLPLLISKLRAKKTDLRICVIGGEEGIAEMVPIHWDNSSDTFMTMHGFQSDWNEQFRLVRIFQPDLVLLGLGMPLELFFINRFYDKFPDSIILTCGGLIRILAEQEKRSPKLMQYLRLEWLYRILSFPKRNLSRYLKGFRSLLILSLKTVFKLPL